MQTERLTLVAFTHDLMLATLRSPHELAQKLQVVVPEGWPEPDFAEILPWLADQVGENPALEEWSRVIVHTTDHKVVGDIGFKGQPDENGVVEMGYSVLPAYRRQGYASEAGRAMLEWALQQPGVKRVTAQCFEDNLGSIGVLQKMGLHQVGQEGKMLKWQSQD